MRKKNQKTMLKKLRGKRKMSNGMTIIDLERELDYQDSLDPKSALKHNNQIYNRLFDRWLKSSRDEREDYIDMLGIIWESAKDIYDRLYNFEKKVECSQSEDRLPEFPWKFKSLISKLNIWRRK